MTDKIGIEASFEFWNERHKVRIFWVPVVIMKVNAPHIRLQMHMHMPAKNVFHIHMHIQIFHTHCR